MSDFLAIKRFVCCIIPVVLCGGCATIMGQSSYDVQIDSSEPGTEVEISEHGKIVDSVITPATVNLKSAGEWSWLKGRKPAMYVFKFTKTGFEPQTQFRAGELNNWSLGNLALGVAFLGVGAVVGICVDMGTGTFYKLDQSDLYVEMKKLPTGPVPKGDKSDGDKKVGKDVSVVKTSTLASLQDNNQQAEKRPKGNDVQPVKQTSQNGYHIISCERESGNGFAYRFVLELTDKSRNSLQTFRLVQQDFRAAVKADYADSYPNVNKDSLFVEFPEYKLNNGRIQGRAVVLTIAVTSLTYDPNTRTGKLAVKVNANQYEEARKWIRKNIETLARDKNIALTTGEIPPAAKFYLGREELKDGNILEIEFKTE